MRQAFDLLESIKPDLPDVEVTLGTKPSGAYLLLSDIRDPDQWAVIYSDGDAWSAVQTNTGHSKIYLGEGSTESEIREILEAFLRIGVAYMQGSRDIVRSRVLRIPSLVVTVGEDRERLALSVVGMIEWMFKPSKRSNAMPG